MITAVQQRIGRHEFLVEEDMLFSTFHGDLVLEESHQYLDLIAKILKRYPAYYACGDVTDMGHLPADARRVLVARHKEMVCASGAVIGATLILRTLLIMTVSALSIVGKNQMPVRFVPNIDEARAWFVLQRQQLGIKAPPS